MHSNALRPALTLFILLSLLLGVAYPSVVTGLAQLFFPDQANGSLIEKDGHILGSRLIGRNFEDPSSFWGRPSATIPFPYNAAASGASNLSPANTALLDAVKQRLQKLREADPGNVHPVPVELVTSSGSGLDPHISPAAALYQVPRVAKARHMGEDEVRALVARHTEPRTFGILGEPRVNVLMLNLALEENQKFIPTSP